MQQQQTTTEQLLSLSLKLHSKYYVNDALIIRASLIPALLDL